MVKLYLYLTGGEGDRHRWTRLWPGCCKVLVHLRARSEDVSSSADTDSDVDLPLDADMTLSAFVGEPCVLASVSSPRRPAFHLPLRTDIDVRLVRCAMPCRAVCSTKVSK